MGDFSATPLDFLLANQQKGYTGLHIEQGVPVLDRDLNLLQDLMTAGSRSLFAHYIGNGLAAGADGFGIEELPAGQNSQNFQITAGSNPPGSCLAGGVEVTIPATINYTSQTSLPSGVPPLTTPQSTQPDPRVDTVYLDVFFTEVNSTADPDLANSQDIGMETSVRLMPAWTVLVAEGVPVPQPPDGHVFYALAQLTRPRGVDTISQSMITDLRQRGLTVSSLEQQLGRLDLAKVDRAGDSISGSLAISGRLGVGAAAGQRRLQVGTDVAGIGLDESDTSPNAGYIRFGDNSGWKLHLGRSREAADASLNIDTTGVLATLQDNGNLGLGALAPSSRLQVKSLTAIDQGATPAGAWANFGANSFYDNNGWHRVDTGKAGVNLRMNADAPVGTEFRFSRVEADDTNQRDIAQIGSQTSFINEGNFGVGTTGPSSRLQVKSLTTVDEGATNAGAWANFGSNAFYNGYWNRADPNKAGVNLRMNGDAGGTEFRFSRVEADGTNQRDIAQIGSQTSFINEGNFCVGATVSDYKFTVVTMPTGQNDALGMYVQTMSDTSSLGGTFWATGRGTFGAIGVQASGVSSGDGPSSGVYSSAQCAGSGAAYGVHGLAGGDGSGTKYGVFGGAFGQGQLWAGYFNGNVNVTGSINKGALSFLIDHPLDPVNKTLRHNQVESPEHLCAYRGKASLGECGQATIQLPRYFPALTDEENATVHLTPVGEEPTMVSYRWNDQHTAVTVYGAPNADVAYLVLAARDDPVIHQLARPVEENKGDDHFVKGRLLYPEAFGYPPEMGVHFDLQQSITALRPPAP